MPTLRLTALTALAAAALGCGVTIPPGSAGLKYRALRTPALSQTIHQPGYYPLWAWNKMVVYDTTTQDMTSEVHVLTADNLHIAATATVTFHPLREKIYELHTEVGPNYYEELLGPAFVTLIRGEFSKHMHNNLAREASEIERAVHDALQARFSERYLVIDQVAINHIDYDSTVTQAISQKIAVKQRFEQKQHEMEIAQRDAEIARTQAQARGDAARIAAEGEAAAIILKGKAQAEAQDAINRTLTPRYLQYKAFDQPNATFYFVPLGKDGLPLIVDTATATPRAKAQ